MSILGDIFSILKEIDGVDFEDAITKKRPSSISKASTSGTLQFPVICTRSLDLETMMMICKALERSYSSFAQITFTQNPIYKVTGQQGLDQYIRKFHQNSDVTFDAHDAFNSVNFLLTEGINVAGVQYEVAGMTYDGREGVIETSNRQQMDSILNHLRYDVINEKYTPRISMVVSNNKDLDARINRVLMEANGQQPQQGNRPAGQNNGQQGNRPAGQNNGQQGNRPATRPNVIDSRFANTKQSNEYNGTVNSTTVYNVKGGSNIAGLSNEITLPRDILANNEVKKSNELVPTMLRLKVMLVDKEGKNNGSLEFLLGIKALLHPVSSEEMTKNIVSACKNNNRVFDFIRWTTGEISFLKDFVFAIDEMKDDVVSKSKGSSPWWSALKRRKALAKVKNKMFLGNNLLPNSTLVMSAEEVDFIKAEYGYDLSDVRLQKKIMETYFLLGFVILDPSTEIAHILFDGQINPQSITFDGLQRENASSKNVDSKEVIKLMNRI